MIEISYATAYFALILMLYLIHDELRTIRKSLIPDDDDSPPI